MRWIIYIAFTLFVFSTNAQVVFNTSYHNFGDLEEGDQTYYDFEITNASKKPIYLLRADEPYAVKVLFSHKKLMPDSSGLIKYTPMKKGRFKKDVEVWVSSNMEPIIFTLEGDAQYADKNEDWACPDFSKKHTPQPTEFNWTIKVVDKETQQPIKSAVVEIIWDGLVYKRFKTGRNGIVQRPFRQEMYYVIANAPGYKSDETDFFLYKKATEVVLELEKKDEDDPEPLVDTLLVDNEEPETSVDTAQELPEDPYANEALSRKEYAPNNVVFLIDISVSMKQKGRLDLLKASMIELLSMLRDIDRFSLVTYASNTDVVLEGIPGDQKQEAIKAIQALEAGGYTAGAKGIKKAYQVAENNFIEKGNNQVIISTDGAFNVDRRNKGILKSAEKHAEKGITISVVGVKNEKWTAKSMKLIAESGQGQYINIETYSQAKSSLVEEIKKNSRISKQ